MTKIWNKFSAEIFIYLSKIAIYLSLASVMPYQAIGEAFSPQKRTSSTSNFILALLDRIRIPNPDPLTWFNPDRNTGHSPVDGMCLYINYISVVDPEWFISDPIPDPDPAFQRVPDPIPDPDPDPTPDPDPVWIHTHTHKYLHTYTHIYTQTHKHKHTYIYSDTHALTHYCLYVTIM